MSSAVTVLDAKQDKPYVILLGWLGALPRHLEKYAELYTSQGYGVVYAVAPAPDVMLSRTAQLKGLAEECLSTVQEKTGEEQGFFCHAFSNGGAFVYEQLSPLLHESSVFQPLSQRLLGTIWDSTPIYLHRWTGVQAITHAFPSRLVRWPLISAFLAYTTIGGVFNKITGTVPRHESFWNGFIQDPARCPSLYIASESDPLQDVDALRDLIEQRKGVIGEDKVTSLIFETSPHVQHLRAHPEEYTKTLYTFLDDAQRGR